MSPPIRAWAYDADIHCHSCALIRFGSAALNDSSAVDSEGNEPHPIFQWDELGDLEHCGDCHEEL